MLASDLLRILRKGEDERCAGLLLNASGAEGKERTS